MAQTSRTFCIFVSSTFSDLKEERNALQKNVFPMLRELCMQHGCRFQAIDLRWGVREEASLDQQTMKICLEEIQRCQRVTPRHGSRKVLGGYDTSSLKTDPHLRKNTTLNSFIRYQVYGFECMGTRLTWIREGVGNEA